MLPLELDLRDPMGQAKSGPPPRPIDVTGADLSKAAGAYDQVARGGQRGRCSSSPDGGAADDRGSRSGPAGKIPATSSRVERTSYRHPTVEHELLAGHKGGVVRRQVDRTGCNLRRRREASHSDLGDPAADSRPGRGRPAPTTFVRIPAYEYSAPTVLARLNTPAFITP